MAKKQTQTEWIEIQLNKYEIEKVKERFEQFKKKFPKSNFQSYNVSVDRVARNLGVKKNTNDDVVARQKKMLLNEYSMFVKNNKDIPKAVNLGTTKAKIVKIFGSMDALDDQAREQFPKRFKDVADHKVWTKERAATVKKKVKEYKRFIVTTAVGGCPVDRKFYENLKLYCEKKEAKLLILVADQLDEIDPILKDESIVFQDMSINSNLHIDTIKILPKALDPTTGIDRIAAREGSFIFGSTKQRLVYLPTGIPGKRLPYANMTTGAITQPFYMSPRYYQKRTDKLAEIDHVMGAIIVEVEDRKHYHFRQIQADSEGRFVDLGIEYPTGKKMKSKISAGDWHVGETDPKVANGIYNLAKRIECDSIILHDLFNGHSINHHEKNNSVTRALTYSKGMLNLKDELEQYVDEINNISKHFKHLEIVRSNHDDFVDKYINDDAYTKDPQNIRIAWELCIAHFDGHNPLEWWTRNSGKLNDKSKVEWLSIGEERFFGDIKYSDHGHLGANGSRGTLRGLEKTNAKAVYGHSHTAQIMRETWQNGTSTITNPPYVKGPTSWTQSSTIIYENGQRQLINFIDGEYTI